MGDFWHVVRIGTYGHRRSYRSDGGPPTTKTAEISKCRRHARWPWLLEPDTNGKFVCTHTRHSEKREDSSFFDRKFQTQAFHVVVWGEKCMAIYRISRTGPEHKQETKVTHLQCSFIANPTQANSHLKVICNHETRKQVCQFAFEPYGGSVRRSVRRSQATDCDCV